MGIRGSYLDRIQKWYYGNIFHQSEVKNYTHNSNITEKKLKHIYQTVLQFTHWLILIINVITIRASQNLSKIIAPSMFRDHSKVVSTNTAINFPETFYWFSFNLILWINKFWKNVCLDCVRCDPTQRITIYCNMYHWFILIIISQFANNEEHSSFCPNCGHIIIFLYDYINPQGCI